jgi:serine/threonine-protein kinase RsbW
MQSVRVPAKYKYLALISEFVGQAADDANLDDAAIYAVQLAVDEACSNIMEHAYLGKGQGEIICSYEILDDGIKIILSDMGKPLNPADVPEFDLNATLEELNRGGAGVYLMHRLMDQVHYETDPQLGNKLELVKRKEHQ